MSPKLTTRIVSDGQTPCTFKLSDLFLISKEAQIVNDQKYFNATPSSVFKFLKSDSSHVFMIHGISLNTDKIFSIVDMFPQYIEKAIIVLVDLH